MNKKKIRAINKHMNYPALVRQNCTGVDVDVDWLWMRRGDPDLKDIVDEYFYSDEIPAYVTETMDVYLFADLLEERKLITFPPAHAVQAP